MGTPFFFDTSYILALEVSDDQNHDAAIRHWHQMMDSRPLLVTTSYVLDEVLTFFNSRGRHAKAVEIGNRIITSALIQLVHVDEALFYEAWAYFSRHSDKRYSFTDCLSFVVMDRLNIRTAFAFDYHFVQAGLEKSP